MQIATSTGRRSSTKTTERYLKFQNKRPFFKILKNHLSGTILHYLCIFDRKFQNKLAYILQFGTTAQHPSTCSTPSPGAGGPAHTRSPR